MAIIAGATPSNSVLICTNSLKNLFAHITDTK